METSWEYVEKCRSAYMRRGWNFVTQVYYDIVLDTAEKAREKAFRLTKSHHSHYFIDRAVKQEDKLWKEYQAWKPNPHL